ncbi:MAG TPA: ABC transporter ATP-binding protein [Mesotoga infera]|uniref:ABC-type multidrug transport system, ATPase component n=1 Tax=Mesotoga infera TaxID=1236046 RepID=A0A7Z7PMZ9_9BACT|nr:ABC transporter ATP-binding protein [Mesotoga infera]MBP8660736.1 ABC transporter ATP-binding protein [Mesotoga sp.]NLI06540.1 ABC transporter ATP-binding protein [Thermotogaceae bacterium]SSC12391.1 ABC-type multidrug transport system, ATPase component [Mesotoga infera]HOI35473.1 ABC transporter ATP-binding protein [Mesotoga infera]HON27297.1 ABC transporter ATP-binding protein [Mesotoga infera]
MPKTAINVRNLKKYYGETKAVDDISFNLMEGEVLAILGPNGAGKTTTVEMLEGLRRPDSGTIEYFEEKLPPSSDRVKEEIGVQLQSSSFFEYLSVKETLDLFRGLYTKGISSDELIKEVSLDEKKKTYTKNLSGGQLQRLAVAVSLVNDPKVIFLDEPTTGLDPQARRMLWETVLNLKKKQKTIILTTHYMEEAEHLADRIIIMDHGKIISRGTLDELIASIETEDIVSFRVRGEDEIPQEFLEMEGLKHVENRTYAVTTKDVERALGRLFERSKKFEILLDDVTIRKPNLEDVFITLTGRKLRD